jgi:hypothetical protein
LTVEGRFATALFSEVAAFAAAPHWCEVSATEIDCSWPLRLLLWSADSRPLPPPQATTKAAANPRPPARNAREPKPIGLTLEAAAVCLKLGLARRLLPIEQALSERIG